MNFKSEKLNTNVVEKKEMVLTPEQEAEMKIQIDESFQRVNNIKTNLENKSTFPKAIVNYFKELGESFMVIVKDVKDHPVRSAIEFTTLVASLTLVLPNLKEYEDITASTVSMTLEQKEALVGLLVGVPDAIKIFYNMHSVIMDKNEAKESALEAQG